jgi:rhodanese-related sulfurtransferase
MMKRLLTLAAAGALFLGVNTASAQCTHDAGGKCEKKGACCSAKEKESPSLSQLKTVTRQDLAAMIQAKQVVVLDARGEKEFAAGHIEGALNLAATSLPADKNAKLVFYCGGIHCPVSTKAAKEAVAKGYKNVMVYRGGWAEWSKNTKS